MKKENSNMKTAARTTLCYLVALMTVFSFLFGTIPASAQSGPYYIGTVTDQLGNLTLSSGSGYTFYSDSTCMTVLNGSMYITDPTVIYVKANTNYTIWDVSVQGSNGSPGVGEIIENGGVYSISFPESADCSQVINVTTAVSAPGGIVNMTSTASEVAGLFNTGATGNTDNITVEKSNAVFTVTLKNNLILESTIALGTGVTLNVLSIGDNMILRGEMAGNIFNVSNADSVLTLGSGIVQSDTVTYYFNDRTSATQGISDELPTPPTDGYITHAEINSVITPTMTGTLTIDGGADLNLYTGTEYSYIEATTEDNNNLIKVSNGSRVNMWDGVILQNNVSLGNDTAGGIGINVNNAKLYLYGGIIRRCVNCKTNFSELENSSSLGDGGALMLYNSSTEAYIYNAEITNCESDNSSAISLWSGSKLYFINGTIRNNFAVGDLNYPAQAMSVYGSSYLFMFGGNISSNQGINASADLRVSSGSNILHLFGGTINSLGSNVQTNTINIYSGHVERTTGLGEDDDMQGTIWYAGGIQYQITIPNAVNVDGSQTVHAVVTSDDAVVGTFDSVGTGSSNLSTFLTNGTYEFTVTSISMIKTYSVEVLDENETAIPTGRQMTTPVLDNRTSSSVTLKAAGTGNATDGSIQYGYTIGNAGTPVNWQDENVFTGLAGGTYYFYVKALDDGLFLQSTCDEPYEITLGGAPTVSLGHDTTLICGGSVTIAPITTPANYPVDLIQWSLIGENVPETRISVNSDGSCTVTVSVFEDADTLTLTATLEDGATDSIAIILISSQPVVRPVNGKTLNLITAEASTSLSSGNIFSFNIGFSYESDNSVGITSTDALPVGTQIIMTDWTNASAPAFYYCKVASPQTEFSRESFTKMGGTEHPIEVGQSTYIRQFCFILPSNHTLDDLTLGFSSIPPVGNANNISDAYLIVTFTPISNPSGMVTLGNPASNTPGTLSALLTISTANVPIGYKAISVIQIENNANMPIDYPDRSVVMFGTTKATVRGNIAYFCVTKNTVATNNITISGLSDGVSYKLRSYVFIIPEEINNPMNGIISDTDVSTTATAVKATPDYSLKATLTAGSRIIYCADIFDRSATLTFSIDYLMSYGESDTINVSFYKKIEGEYTPQSGWTVNGSSLFGVTDGRNTVNGVTITIPQGSTEGTYRIKFILGNGEYIYNIIIK